MRAGHTAIHVAPDRAWIPDDSGSGEDVPAQSVVEEDAGAAVKVLLHSGATKPGAAIRLHVHEPLAQIRTLRGLPPVNGSDLGRLVSLQHQRYFRPVRGGVATGAIWVPDGEERLARGAALPATLLRDVEEKCAELGLTLDRVVATNTDSPDIPIESERMRAARGRRRRRRGLAQLSLALGGWLVAGGGYVADLVRDGAAMERELVELEPVLAQIRSIEASVASFAPIVEALNEQSAEQRWLTPTLAQVGASIPPEVHLHALDLDEAGRVTIEAHGGDGLALVSDLSVWWDGRIRLVANTEGPPSDAPYTLILEPADGTS